MTLSTRAFRLSPGFNSSAFTSFLESPTPGEDSASKTLSSWLALQFPNSNLQQQSGTHPLDRLRESDVRTLNQRFGAGGVAALRSLGTETSLPLFYSDLMGLGRDLEQQGLLEGAGAIYQLLTSSSLLERELAPAIQEQAVSRLALLRGEGSMGDSLEYYGRQIVEGVTDVPSLLAFGVAGTTFRIGRLASARWLMAQGPKSIAQSALGLRVASGLGGFALEGAMFPVVHMAGNQALGRSVDWSASHLQQSLLSSYLFLGGLRAGGVLGRSGYLWARSNQGMVRALTGSVAFSRSAPALIPLSAQLSGVLLGQWGQESLGLSETRSLSQHMVAGVVTMIQMQGMGALHHGLTRNNLGRMERSLDLHTETLLRNIRRSPQSSGWNTLSPQMALAAVGPGEFLGKNNRTDPRLVHHVFSMGNEGEGGGKGSSQRPRSAASKPAGREISDPQRNETAAAFLLEPDPARFDIGLRNFIESQDLPIAVAWLKIGRKAFSEGLGKVFMVNEAFGQKFGFNSETIQQYSLIKLFNRVDAIRVGPMIPLRIASGHFPPVQMRMRHVDGSWVPVVGSGLYRKIFDRVLAFGFFRDIPTETHPNLEPIPMVEMMRGTSRGRQKTTEGTLDMNSLVELNLQMAQSDSPILARLRERDLTIKLHGFASPGILARQADAWIRFINYQDRREPFPADRRLDITVPAGVDHLAERLSLVRGPNGFHPVGKSIPLSTPDSSGSRPTSDPVRSSGSPKRFSPTGTYARVTAALEGREIPRGNEGSQETFIQKLKSTQIFMKAAVDQQGHWGGEEVRLRVRSSLVSKELERFQVHLLSYLNYLTGPGRSEIEITGGLRVVLEVEGPDGVQEFRFVRNLDRFVPEGDAP